MEFVDLDGLVKEHVPQPSCLKNHPLAPQHPFFWAISAPTGGGKTYSLIQLMLQGLIKFDHLYLFIKDVHEDKWQFLLKFLNTISDSAKSDPLFTVGTKAEDVPNPDEMEKEGTKLFIFDDFINDKKANNTVVLDLFTRGRKKNCSVVYLTQSYYALNKTTRINCNYFSLFGVASQNELRTLASEHGAEIGYQKMREYFQTALSKPYGFLFIDKKTNDPDLKYRSGFFNHIESGENLINKFSEEHIDEQEE